LDSDLRDVEEFGKSGFVFCEQDAIGRAFFNDGDDSRVERFADRLVEAQRFELQQYLLADRVQAFPVGLDAGDCAGNDFGEVGKEG